MGEEISYDSYMWSLKEKQKKNIKFKDTENELKVIRDAGGGVRKKMSEGMKR